MSTSPDRTSDRTGDWSVEVHPIHRLLDEAFAGVEMTPERQDLKEEIRGNLLTRVAELQRTGVPAGAAASRAMEEFGDVRFVVDTAEPAPGDLSPQRAWRQHRVRPKPGFLVRTVLLGAVAAAAAVTYGFAVAGSGVPVAGQLIAVVVLALAAGVIVADALRQETTGSYPIPTGRTLGYGAATALAVTGLGTGSLYLREENVLWLVGGALVVVASTVLFTYLGATQTNRHKPWMFRLQAAHHEAGDRFEKDRTAAERFGLYTAVIWIIAIAAFLVLSFTVGWAWSWLAIVGGCVVMMLTLARMLFAPQH
jgi:hypothetical protein